MHRDLLPFFLPALTVVGTAATAQTTVLDYRFDSASAARVVNYASNGSPAPSLGHLVAASADPLTRGHFGAGALRGGYPHDTAKNFVATGWDGAFTGAFTIGFFARNRGSNSPAIETDLLGSDTFRIASGGTAGKGLAVFGWGGAPLVFDQGTELCSEPYWVHYAIVVDPTSGRATWYREGEVVQHLPMTTVPTVAASTLGFRIGAATDPARGSLYDLDEVRFVLGAVDVQTIRTWMDRPLAATAPFGTGSPDVDLSPIGLPRIGEDYGLSITGEPATAWVLALGFDRDRLGSTPLPLDLGTIVPSASGLFWHTAIAATAAGMLDAHGEALLTLEVPAEPSLAGSEMFGQALLLDGHDLAVTPALAHVIGH